MNRPRLVERNRWRYTEWTAPPPKRVWFWNRTGVNAVAWIALVVTSLTAVAAITGVLMMLGRGHLPLEIAVPFVIVMTVAAVVVPIVISKRISRDIRSGVEVRDLMDLPQIVPQYPVEVVYKVGKTRYGSDVGVLSFTGSLLTFQGCRSRFSFDNSSIQSLGPDSHRGRRQTELWYGVEDEWLSVQIHCFDSTPGTGRGFQKMFGQELKEWRTHPSHGFATNIMPPLQAESREVLRARVSSAASAAAICATVFAIWTTHLPSLWPPTHWPWSTLVLLFGFALQLGAARTDTRNLRILRAVEEDRRRTDPALERSTIEEQPHKLSL